MRHVVSVGLAVLGLAACGPAAPPDPLAAMRAQLAAIDWNKPGALLGDTTKVADLEANPDVKALADKGDPAAETLVAMGMMTTTVAPPPMPGDPPPPPDKTPQILQLLQSAVDQGFAPAMVTLGQLKLNPRNDAAPDPKGALDLFVRAADTGMPLGEMLAGGFLLTAHDSVPADLARSVAYMKAAADHGVPFAQVLMGALYGRLGVTEKDYQTFGSAIPPPDDDKAARLLKLAAPTEPMAKGFLGYMTEFGRGGISASRDNAVKLYNECAMHCSYGDRDFTVDQLNRLGLPVPDYQPPPLPPGAVTSTPTPDDGMTATDPSAPAADPAMASDAAAPAADASDAAAPATASAPH